MFALMPCDFGNSRFVIVTKPAESVMSNCFSRWEHETSNINRSLKCSIRARNLFWNSRGLLRGASSVIYYLHTEKTISTDIIIGLDKTTDADIIRQQQQSSPPIYDNQT